MVGVIDQRNKETAKQFDSGAVQPVKFRKKKASW